MSCGRYRPHAVIILPPRDEAPDELHVIDLNPDRPFAPKKVIRKQFLGMVDTLEAEKSLSAARSYICSDEYIPLLVLNDGHGWNSSELRQGA
jgi:hypothetical protein